MPRRVFTYPAGIGWDWLNLVSTIGAFVLRRRRAASSCSTCLRPKHRQPQRRAEPVERRHAGMAQRTRGELGRALDPARREPLSALGPAEPVARSRTRARCYLAGRRGRPARDAGHLGARRRAGAGACASAAPPTSPSSSAVVARRGLRRADLQMVDPAVGLRSASSCRRDSGGSGPAPREIPEKTTKHVGHGLSLPLYASGPASVGWWAMFITMVGDGTAFASLIFGYFFYWTIHDGFHRRPAGPGVVWPMAGPGLFAAGLGRHARGAATSTRAASPGRTRLALAAAARLDARGRCRRPSPVPGRHAMDRRPRMSIRRSSGCSVSGSLAHGAVGVDHAALLPGAQPCRSLDGRARHRHPQCRALLALSGRSPPCVTFVVVGLFPEAM